MNPLRNCSRQIKVGPVPVGGGAPVSIQSMTNADTRDTAATLAQINRLADAGCDIVRVAVPDLKAADAIRELVRLSPIPVIADIHFDYHLALASIASGAHAVRINPGNLADETHVRAVVEAAGNAGIPIRVGANAGSLPRGMVDEFRKRGLSHDDALAEALVSAAESQLAILERYGFRNAKVSLKASSVPVTVAACRLFSARHDFPLHLGVTEAGTPRRGTVKNAVGIGTLLLDGIGDTLRVSLTAPPEEEVRTALLLLETVGLRDPAPEIISCPTCGRTEFDLIALAEQVEDMVRAKKADGTRVSLRKIAVMGCPVNGPGEARDADIGLAGSAQGNLVLFRHGRILESLPAHAALARFEQLLDESLIPPATQPETTE